jgi:DNA-binding transcriptional regulator YiaG
MAVTKKNTNPKEPCADCGSAKVRAIAMPYEQSIGSVSFVSKLPAVECTACGARLVAADILGKFEMAVARWLASSGPVDSQAFRFMRKAIGLPAQVLAQLLEVTPETLSRWEHDKQALDRNAFAILAALVEDAVQGKTGTIERLRSMRSPTKAAKRTQRVSLAVA